MTRARLASRSLVATLALASAACSAANKETAVQSGMTSGMVACEALLLDKSIPRTPEAEAWCEVVINGCPDARP